MNDTVIKLKYPEAFCLVCYAPPDNKNGEILWNSRDGFVPPVITSPIDGQPMHRTAISFAPAHQPVVGERIIVDMTEQRARALAAQDLERSERTDRATLEEMYPSREEALNAFVDRYRVPHTPDILVVNSGYLETMREWLPTAASLIQPAAPTEKGVGRYYDRKGRVIDMFEWSYLFGDIGYKQLKHTTIDANTWVSTIWMGIDHGFSFDPLAKPVIFETMCFRRMPEPKPRRGGGSHEFDEDGQWRWRTEEEALAGHETVCAEVRQRNARERKGVS
jgi:hypothetical protein